MDLSEIEFLAERKFVTITPNLDMSALHFISGDVGPFRAGLPVKVPLWVAINLRQRRKCRIMAPDWMNVETLEEIKENESKSDLFTKMPSEHYMEESQMILSAAGDDVPGAGEIRVLLKDIWDIRQSKLRTSATLLLQRGGRHAQVNHLSQMEINSIRPLLPHSMDLLRRLQADSGMDISTQAGQSQSQLDLGIPSQ